uniref:Medium-chain acyl-CoA ligase ACSF2, mitochondrial n=1 Tax=Timema tahoe TaxID=61484 RepID=A0A7R9I9X2_9NEOP|nr:unnamed protein product [Timema tahoe]
MEGSLDTMKRCLSLKSSASVFNLHLRQNVFRRGDENTMREFLIILVHRLSEGRCLFVGWKPSYYHNPGTEPLSPLTIGQIVDQSVEKFGDNEALVSVQQGHRVTFQQVREKADRLAAGLLEIGLQPGDRLGLWSTNCSEWYITSFAAARAGLTLVNINPAYQSSELKYCINKVGLKALMMGDTFKTQNFHQLLSQVSPEIRKARPGQLNSESVPSLKSVIVMTNKNLPGVFQYEDIMDAGSKESIISFQQLWDVPTKPPLKLLAGYGLG